MGTKGKTPMGLGLSFLLLPFVVQHDLPKESNPGGECDFGFGLHWFGRPSSSFDCLFDSISNYLYHSKLRDCPQKGVPPHIHFTLLYLSIPLSAFSLARARNGGCCCCGTPIVRSLALCFVSHSAPRSPARRRPSLHLGCWFVSRVAGCAPFSPYPLSPE